MGIDREYAVAIFKKKFGTEPRITEPYFAGGTIASSDPNFPVFYPDQDTYYFVGSLHFHGTHDNFYKVHYSLVVGDNMHCAMVSNYSGIGFGVSTYHPAIAFTKLEATQGTTLFNFMGWRMSI